MTAFYHDKNTDSLKLSCTLPSLANFCLHKSTCTIFYPFTEAEKDLLEKIRQVVFGGLSIIFTRKAVVDETFNQKSRNVSKSNVGNDGSQLHPHPTCQPLPTRL